MLLAGRGLRAQRTPDGEPGNLIGSGVVSNDIFVAGSGLDNGFALRQAAGSSIMICVSMR